MTKQTDTAKRWTRALVNSGILLYVLLAAITAVWWTAEGELSNTYSLVMIPMSAVGVICVFAGLLVLILAEIKQNRVALARLSGDLGEVKAMARRLTIDISQLKAAIQRAHIPPAKPPDAGVSNGHNGHTLAPVPEDWLNDMTESFRLGRTWQDLHDDPDAP